MDKISSESESAKQGSQVNSNNNFPKPQFARWLFLLVIIAVLGYGLVKIPVDSLNGSALLPFFTGKSAVKGNSLTKTNDDLVKELGRYLKASAKDKAKISDNLTKIAENRKNKLTEKITKRDKNFSQEFLPADILSRLPDAARNLSEERVKISGRLDVIVIDIVDGLNSEGTELTVRLVPDSEYPEDYYEIYLEDNEAPYLAGENVKINGIKFPNDRRVYVEKGGVSAGDPNIKGVVAKTGTRKILAILFNFSNNTSQPWTKETVYARLFTNLKSLKAHYLESSFSKLDFTGEVTPWFTINDDNLTCDWSNWGNLARQIATNAGYNLNSYDHIMHIFPRVSTSVCNWAGLGYMPGLFTFINGDYNVSNGVYRTDIHEIGHNLGLAHSASYNCGSSQINATCTQSEYGDKNAIMGGYNYFQFHGPNKYVLGWYNSSQYQTVTSNGIYAISSTENTAGALKQIRIPRPGTSDYYYISYRQPIGFDSGLASGVVRGASVHLWNDNGSSLTKMLFMAADGNFTNSALWDGGSFVDSANGIRVTQLSHDANEAMVQVNLESAVCDRSNPTITLNPTSGSGNAANYTVSVRNNNSSGCGTTTYNLSTALPSGWIYNYNSSSLSLSYGTSANSTLTITAPSSTPNGTYSFTVRATDDSNSAYTAIANGAQSILSPSSDTELPVVTIVSPTNGTSVGNRTTVQVNAKDNIGVVKLELYIDGRLVTTTTASSMKYVWNSRKISKGSHGIVAKAYDAAGNMSSHTITVNK